MKLYKYSWFILFIFFSCRQNTSHEKIFIRDARLKLFKMEMVYSINKFETLDTLTFQEIISNNFNPKTDTIKYLKNKIYISYLRVLPGCAKYEGNIEFKKDTLKLFVENLSRVVCTEEDCLRLIYEIDNKENKKYIVEMYK